MNGVARNTQHRALWEEFPHYGQPTLRDNAGKAESGSRMDAQCLVNASIEVGQPLHLLSIGNRFVFGSELFIKLFVQFLLGKAVASQVVNDGAG